MHLGLGEITLLQLITRYNPPSLIGHCVGYTEFDAARSTLTYVQIFLKWNGGRWASRCRALVDATTPRCPNWYHGLLRQSTSGIKYYGCLIFFLSYFHSPYHLFGLWYFQLHLLSISRIEKVCSKIDMLPSLPMMKMMTIYPQKLHSSSLKRPCRFRPSGRSFLLYL